MKATLRNLRLEDAAAMNCWMHDEAVVRVLNAEKFIHTTVEDCQSFIRHSLEDEGNYHQAIADENDDYAGTVSLKNINRNAGDAEFAIVLCSEYQRKGLGRFAMTEILKYAFDTIKLTEVYWTVRPDNTAARKLYDGIGGENMGLLSDCPGLKPDCGADNCRLLRYRITAEKYKSVL